MDSQIHKIGIHTPGKQSRKYREIGAGRSLVQGPDSLLQKKPRSPLSIKVITSSSSKTNPFTHFDAGVMSHLMAFIDKKQTGIFLGSDEKTPSTSV